MSDGLGPCPGCGEPTSPQDTACGSCGRIARKTALRLGDVFGVAAAGAVGAVGGLILGAVLGASVFTALGVQSPNSARSALLYTLAVGIPIGACYFAGIRFARRGRSVEAWFFLTLAIGATLPTAACDVGLWASIGRG